MRATLTLSLGATKRGPPRTCRGTMVNPAAAAVVVAMKRRRVMPGFASISIPLRGDSVSVDYSKTRTGGTAHGSGPVFATTAAQTQDIGAGVPDFRRGRRRRTEP